MSVLPDPSLVVLTGGEVQDLRRAAEELVLPAEIFDASRMPAVELLREVDSRLRGLRLACVVDAHDDRELRDELRRHAKRHCLPAVAVSLLGDERESGLRAQGFSRLLLAEGLAELQAAPPERRRLGCDRRGETGPFDIVGDVHGCFVELVELLERLGYSVEGDLDAGFTVTPPQGRRALFVGDLVDRGPGAAETLQLGLDMHDAGTALLLPGNHEAKLARALAGAQVKLSHGLDRTLEQLEGREALQARFLALHESLPDHLVLDGGRLVVAHAGLEERYHGRESARVRSLALFGPTTGETDEKGYPVRIDWTRSYRGAAHVVFGHTPVAEARWVNRAMNVDTGCVFGGSLTALRWPEQELVSVPARETYWEA